MEADNINQLLSIHVNASEQSQSHCWPWKQSKRASWVLLFSRNRQWAIALEAFFTSGHNCSSDLFYFPNAHHKTTTNIKLISYVFSVRKKRKEDRRQKTEQGEEVGTTSREKKEGSKEGGRGKQNEPEKEKQTWNIWSMA